MRADHQGDIIELVETVDPSTGETVFTEVPTEGDLTVTASGVSFVGGEIPNRHVGEAAQGRMAADPVKQGKGGDPWADLNDFFAAAEQGTSDSGTAIELLPGGSLQLVDPRQSQPGHEIGQAAKGRMA